MAELRRGRRPNVVLLVLDALRADALEPYGAPKGASPALAGLARTGVVAPSARATASWTLPSHMAMFTGVLARSLGLGQAPGGLPHGAAPVVRAQRDRLLAEVLRREGFATAGATTNVWAGKASGFDTGFERFVELDTSRQNALGGNLRHRLRWDLEGVRATADDGAAQAREVLGGWMRAGDERPFFWFVNLVECHGPYLPPKPWHGASAFVRLLAADEACRYLTFEGILRAGLGIAELPDGALRRMRRLYAASVRYADAWVGGFVEMLEQAGHLEQTLLVICSDHGENLGEDGLLAHGMSLDERLLRVPLIAAGPGAEELAGMLSLAELPSRLMRAVGIDSHPFPAGLVDGLPVAQWDPWDLPGERVDELRSKWRLDEEAMARLISPLTCAVLDRLKLVRGATGGEERVYDLEADPLERAPLGPEALGRPVVAEPVARLRKVVGGQTAQARGEVGPAPEEASPEEVADIERRMRAMGYL